MPAAALPSLTPHRGLGDPSYLGPIQVGVAYVLMTMGLRHTPALESSMILLAEPAINPIWTALFLHEIPGPLSCWAAR